MKTLIQIKRVIDKICKYILIICFAVMTVTYFSQIVLRYAFGTGFRWTEELTRYTNILLVMIGSAVMAGSKSHINVSILETIVPEKYIKPVFLIQQILTIVFFGAAIFLGFDMMKLANTQLSTNLRIPMKLVYGLFPISFIILTFQTVVYVLTDIFELGKKEEA